MLRKANRKTRVCYFVFSAFLLFAVLCGPVKVCAQPSNDAAQVDGLAALAALEQVFVRVIEQAESSIVSIARIRIPPKTTLQFEDRNNFRRFGFNNRNNERDVPEGADFIPNDFGAGIIIAPTWNPTDRLILTNYHVIKGGGTVAKRAADGEVRLYVRFANRRGGYATIVAADPRSDLAVLKVDFMKYGIDPSVIKPIRFASKLNLKKGQIVLTLGNPYAIARDGTASASWGMISNLERRPAPAGPGQDIETARKQTLHHFGTLLQIDNRLDLGSSGGAVLNLKGELIGIATSLAALDGYEKSVGYAVPVDSSILRIIETLTRGHEVEYGFLGVTLGKESIRRDSLILRGATSVFDQISAAKIETVYEQSPAQRGGMQSGDIVLAVNDHFVFGQYDLMRRVGQLGPESVARLRIWRQKTQRELNLNVELGKWPVHNDDDIIATVRRYPDFRGLRIDFSTARYKYLQGPSLRYFNAVLVTDIAAESAADRSELKEGDYITHVNDTPVSTPAEFHRAVRGQKGELKFSLVGRSPVVLLSK